MEKIFSTTSLKAKYNKFIETRAPLKIITALSIGGVMAAGFASIAHSLGM